MEYGEITKSGDVTYYVVESTFPDADRPEKQGYGQFMASAFTDKRDPGSRKWFSAKNADVCAVDSRYHPREALVFTNAEDALACAKRLAKYGVLACRYDYDADWNLRSRGMKLKTRVVEHHSFTIERIVAKP